MAWKGSRKLKGEFRQKYRVFGENSKKRGRVQLEIWNFCALSRNSENFNYWNYALILAKILEKSKNTTLFYLSFCQFYRKTTKKIQNMVRISIIEILKPPKFCQNFNYWKIFDVSRHIVLYILIFLEILRYNP